MLHLWLVAKERGGVYKSKLTFLRTKRFRVALKVYYLGPGFIGEGGYAAVGPYSSPTQKAPYKSP